MTDDCPVGDLVCVVSHAGSMKDMMINYPLVLVNAVPFLRGPRRKRRWYLFGFFAAFQIGLCLVLGCSGVSIIWCALWGAADRSPLAAVNTIAVLYYALTSEALNTIAHLCAVALGLLCWYAFLKPGRAKVKD